MDGPLLYVDSELMIPGSGTQMEPPSTSTRRYSESAHPPEALWEAFAEGAVREQIGGVEVALPSHAARLLHISFHAVQHGGETWDKPMSDLEQAIAKAPERTWVEAREMAARLGFRHESRSIV